MISGKDQLYFLLNRIADIKARTVSNRPLIIDPTNDLNQNYRDIELKQWFTKLEVDEKVLKILKAPSRTKQIDIVEDLDPYDYADDGCWHIELLPAFDRYFLKIQQEPEYQEFTGKKPQTAQVQNEIQPKPNRKVLEKIWNVLQEIEEKKQLGSKNSPIRLAYYPTPQKRDDNGQFETRKTVLEKLQSLEAITGLHKVVAGGYYYWSFNLGDNYPTFLSEHEEAYKEVAQNYQRSQEEEKANARDIVYEVKYSEKSREILANNFLLAKPDFNSENEVVFSYLFRNANRPVKTEELEQQAGNKLKKPIHNILRDLGFTGKLAKAFFGASKNGVIFRNPITHQDLKDLGIERIKIQEKK